MSTYAISINRKWLYKRINSIDLPMIMESIAMHCRSRHTSAKIYNNESHACTANFHPHSMYWDINPRSKFYKELENAKRREKRKESLK